MNKSFDVVIIGSGIIGNTLAAHLAKEDLNIGIINPLNYSTPASIAAAGLLTPYQIHELENAFLKDFCINSYKYFLSFYEGLNQYFQNTDLGFRKPGSLYLIFSNNEIAQKENEIKQLKNTNASISFINKGDVSNLEPLLTKDIVGAYFYKQEGFINNPKFLNLIKQYCIENKVRYINNSLQEIQTSKGKIEHILLNNGEILQGSKFVLCNGVWANKFLKKLINTKEDLIKPIKGEILQAKVNEEEIPERIIFSKDGYIVPRPKTNKFETPSILAGSTSEEVSLDDSNIDKNSIHGISSLCNLIQKIIPSFKEKNISNMWTGLRPMSPDKMPILGQVEGIENLYLSLGHYRNGILMAPFCGKILKEIICNDKTDYDIAPFLLKRFIKIYSLPPVYSN